MILEELGHLVPGIQVVLVVRPHLLQTLGVHPVDQATPEVTKNYGWVVYRDGQAFNHLFDSTWSVRPATQADWEARAETMNRMVPCL